MLKLQPSVSAAQPSPTQCVQARLGGEASGKEVRFRVRSNAITMGEPREDLRVGLPLEFGADCNCNTFNMMSNR